MDERKVKTVKQHNAMQSLKMVISMLISCQTIIGCAFFVTGAVVGAGAYTYVNGELKRSYQAAYEQTVQASLSAMKEMNIEVISIEKQGLTTTIEGNINGKPVVTRISRMDVNISEVAVRSGYVGVWDKNFSTAVHEKIALHL
ncbi:hypothetical protein B2D07_19500 [Desulfococcus multivorans]|uniref:DUF3568 family protein n=1 Tax=Desulfococcus multivorans DSM 2059 TaxID=1121405 RepID=S7TDM1_DESML|nr:hypothetical protein B2D07_19500 [Desulfococcus multivorans]EPR34685.1 Protein of unknown function DUF3568 [Desulfococcus multivorans DSM 2059]SKA02874.1 Protein of unknown function [Desulfococcus multivorans DSM 2059]